jgi:hypothetical protein
MVGAATGVAGGVIVDNIGIGLVNIGVTSPAEIASSLGGGGIGIDSSAVIVVDAGLIDKVVEGGTIGLAVDLVVVVGIVSVVVVGGGNRGMRGC